MKLEVKCVRKRAFKTLQCFSFAFLLLSVVFHDLSNDFPIF
jgi:hypothetical protein